MEKKMTVVNALNYVLDNCDIPEDVSEKLAHMRDQASKRSNSERKMSPAQVANNALRSALLAEMPIGEYHTLTEWTKLCESAKGLSVNKMNGLFKPLKDSKVIDRIEEKGVAKFARVAELEG